MGIYLLIDENAIEEYKNELAEVGTKHIIHQ